jgi:ABC-type multidrug transport system fused ATPase/permease subunit
MSNSDAYSSGTARNAGSSLPVMRVFSRCLYLLRPVRWHLAALVTAFAVLALVLLVPSLMLFDIFWTRILQGEPFTEAGAAFLGLDPAVVTRPGEFTPELRKAAARRAAWIAFALISVSSPLFLALWYYQVWILQRVNHLLRLTLMDRLQALSLRFHAESRVGDAIYRVYQDSAMVTQLIEVLVVAPLLAGGRYLFSLAIVFLFDPRLALLLAAVWPPALLLGLWISPRLRGAFRQAREANSNLTSRIQETIAAAKVIKAYGAAAVEQQRFERDSLRAFDAAFAARSLYAVMLVGVFSIVAAALLAAGGVAALATREGAELFAKRLFIGGGLTLWNIGLFGFFANRFGDGTNAVRRLFLMWGRVQDISAGLQRVFEILDLEPEVRDAPDALPLSGVRSGVRFAAVTFGYANDHDVVADVSLQAMPGTITAIVGPTGAGKTTLLALLLRLFDPRAGAITIDGVDLRRVTLDSLRSAVAVVLQESYLFQATIRDNIGYAVPHASDSAIRAAARVACAAEFIEALPHGYDTVLGERGSKLSVGQRQRLNIARAILKDAPILLLDEPTAALDAETELAVLENLAAWGRARVIIMVTHRLSTIRRADQVVFLRDGRVVECGSHAELMARGGAYRRLVEMEEAAAPFVAAGGS